jgi:hypothetical protein
MRSFFQRTFSATDQPVSQLKTIRICAVENCPDYFAAGAMIGYYSTAI